MALAVDAKMTEEAAATLDKYIQMTNVSDGLQLSADQCAVSARMYAIEVGLAVDLFEEFGMIGHFRVDPGGRKSVTALLSRGSKCPSWACACSC